MQEEKQGQDLYMDKITRDAEEIEQTIAGYHDQTHRMKQQQVEFVST